MSDTSKDIGEKAILDDKWNGDSIWAVILLLFIFGFGWSNPENPKISELEKKVARLEGQMSMIGGRKYE